MVDLLLLEPGVRASVFLLVAATLFLGERFRPRRPPRPLMHRVSNGALFLTNTLVLRLVSVTSLAGVAAMTHANGWGLFGWTSAPEWLEAAVAIILLDLSMYLQHRLFHWVPWLWRLHAVHHSDTEFDFTTGLRFHLGEILVSFALKAVTVLALGASVWVVIAFEALLSSATLFTHANLELPGPVDSALRNAVVTPDVHRIHHRPHRDEHDRNFGFLLICWDRLFGTYREHPSGTHREMRIGLDVHRSDEDQTLSALLRQPFTRGGHTRR